MRCYIPFYIAGNVCYINYFFSAEDIIMSSNDAFPFTYLTFYHIDNFPLNEKTNTMRNIA